MKLSFEIGNLSTLRFDEYGAKKEKYSREEMNDKVKKWATNMLCLADAYFSSGDVSSSIKVCNILINCPFVVEWDDTLSGKMPEQELVKMLLLKKVG